MLNLNIAADLKAACVSDAALTTLSDKVLLVSSKQLSKILGKKNKGAVTKKEWIEFFIIGAISLTVIGLYSGWPNP